MSDTRVKVFAETNVERLESRINTFLGAQDIEVVSMQTVFVPDQDRAEVWLLYRRKRGTGANPGRQSGAST